MENGAKNESIRVVLQQPKLPAYRIPVFKELAARPGIDLHVFYTNQPGPANAEADGFDASMIDARGIPLGKRTLKWQHPQWKYATKRRADVLMLSWDLANASLVPALVRAKLQGVPTILWGHGYSKNEAGWRRWPRDKVTTLATALMFYNNLAADAFVERGGDRERVFVALNSLDQEPVQQTRLSWSSRQQELNQFKVDNQLDRGPVVLYVSRIEEANRVDLLIDATAALVEKHPQLQTIIIGNGDDEIDRLKIHAERSGVSDQVRFIGPVYGEENISPWMLSADVFCYPANIGLSLLHAFGYGLPAITSDDIASQNPEIEALRHGENGLLYKHGDANDLASAIDQIISDRSTAERMSAEALRTAHEQFSLKNMVDGMESAIRYCAARRSR